MALNSLTRDDLKVLRAATSVSFHFDGREHRVRVTEERRFGTPQPMACEFSTDYTSDGSVGDYRRYGTGRLANGYRCFALLQAAQMSGEWRTILMLLRVGDSLSLRWRASNNSENLDRVGFHADELTLAVQRGSKLYLFPLEHRVGPDDTSRMIRYVDDEPTCRAPRAAAPGEMEALFEEIGRVLSTSRSRHVVAAVPADMAERLPSAHVSARGIEVRFAADAARLDDEVVVVNRERTKLLGHGIVVPAEVISAGGGAEEVYRMLRADGVFPWKARSAALALATPTAGS